MSSITSPIYLNETGLAANTILKGIESALKGQNTVIDDSATSSTSTWSSEKIVKALTSTKSITGDSEVSFSAIAATPLVVKTKISTAPTTVMLEMSSSTGQSRTWSYLVPANGIYNWSDGTLVLENGETTQLVSRFMPAYDGTSTIIATNVDNIEVSYRTIAIGEGGAAPSWEIIDGGDSQNK